MSKITVDLTNVAAIENFKEDIELGKVTLVRSKSATGKSSILRGTVMGLSGSIVNSKPAIQEEAANLEIHDTSDTGLLRINTPKAVSTITSNSDKCSTTLNRSGAVTGTGTVNDKAIYTTMIARVPQTKLYSSVFSPDPDNKNHFGWIADDLSDAEHYQNWLNVLEPLNNQILSLTRQSESWQKEQTELEASIEALEAEKTAVSSKRISLTSSSDEGKDDLANELEDLKERSDKAEDDFTSASNELAEWERGNDQHRRVFDLNKNRIRTAEREIRALEELVRQRITRPDHRELQARLAELAELIGKSEAKLEGAAKHSEGLDLWDKEGKDDQKGLKNYFEEIRTDLDASDSSDSDREEQRSIRDRINREERDWQIATNRQSRATEELAIQNGIKFQAEIDMTEAQGNMQGGDSKRRNLENTVNANKQAFEQAESEYKRKDAELTNLLGETPEQASLRAKEEDIDNQLIPLLRRRKPTLSIRFDALGMLPSEEIEMDAVTIDANLDAYATGGGDGPGIVESNLKTSRPQIQDILNDMLVDGTLWGAVSSTVEHARTKADEHRQAARRIFNEIGTSLFADLSFSPIEDLQLDTDYNLSIGWKNRDRRTGLHGSEGELTIIAAALLIALRKAYTENIPLLMFDSILDNINPDDRNLLFQFLESYAASENIAVLVTQLDDGSIPKLSGL